MSARGRVAPTENGYRATGPHQVADVASQRQGQGVPRSVNRRDPSSVSNTAGLSVVLRRSPVASRYDGLPRSPTEPPECDASGVNQVRMTMQASPRGPFASSRSVSAIWRHPLFRNKTAKVRHSFGNTDQCAIVAVAGVGHRPQPSARPFRVVPCRHSRRWCQCRSSKRALPVFTRCRIAPHATKRPNRFKARLRTQSDAAFRRLRTRPDGRQHRMARTRCPSRASMRGSRSSARSRAIEVVVHDHDCAGRADPRDDHMVFDAAFAPSAEVGDRKELAHYLVASHRNRRPTSGRTFPTPTCRGSIVVHRHLSGAALQFTGCVVGPSESS